MVPCKSTAEEVSFEWSHHRISSTDSKVSSTSHVFIIDSGRKGLNSVVSGFDVQEVNLDIHFPTDTVVLWFVKHVTQSRIA